MKSRTDGVGGVHRKIDALEKMRGVTRYADDIKLPRMLHASVTPAMSPPASNMRLKCIAAGSMSWWQCRHGPSVPGSRSAR